MYKIAIVFMVTTVMIGLIFITSSSKVGSDISSPVSGPKTSEILNSNGTDNLKYYMTESIPSIRALQRMLIAEGYDCGEHAPDGVIGQKTLTSYRHYDKYNCGFDDE